MGRIKKRVLVALILLQPFLCADIDFAELNALYIQQMINENQQEPYVFSENKRDIDPIQVTFEPLDKAILSCQISTPVTKIHKRLGESFKKNEILIETDNAIYKAYVEKGKAMLNKAKVSLEAKHNLFQDGISSSFDVAEAEESVAKAQAELTFAFKQYLACTIRAPYAGKVASLLIAEHELPQAGQVVIEIVGDSVLLGKMLIDANDWNKIAIGKELNIHVNETGKTVKASILRIGPNIDIASSTIKVEAQIDNRENDLIAGMSGTTNLLEDKKSLVGDSYIPNPSEVKEEDASSH